MKKFLNFVAFIFFLLFFGGFDLIRCFFFNNPDHLSSLTIKMAIGSVSLLIFVAVAIVVIPSPTEDQLEKIIKNYKKVKV